LQHANRYKTVVTMLDSINRLKTYFQVKYNIS